MLTNKILPDESRAGNENRAHIHKAGRYQMMTPCDGTGAAGAVSPGELPPGILNSNSMPMTLDAHQNARHSNENRSVAPAEKNRSKYTEEIHHRIHGRDTKYYR
jgi:hypothetical protein